MGLAHFAAIPFYLVLSVGLDLGHKSCIPSVLCSTTCHTLKQVKQNATNNLAPFFKSAFNALSDGVLRFAHCVAP